MSNTNEGLGFSLLLVWRWRKQVKVRKVVRVCCPEAKGAAGGRELRKLAVGSGLAMAEDWPKYKL